MENPKIKWINLGNSARHGENCFIAKKLLISQKITCSTQHISHVMPEFVWLVWKTSLEKKQAWYNTPNCQSCLRLRQTCGSRQKTLLTTLRLTTTNLSDSRWVLPRAEMTETYRENTPIVPQGDRPRRPSPPISSYRRHTKSPVPLGTSPLRTANHETLPQRSPSWLSKLAPSTAEKFISQLLSRQWSITLLYIQVLEWIVWKQYWLYTILLPPKIGVFFDLHGFTVLNNCLNTESQSPIQLSSVSAPESS